MRYLCSRTFGIFCLWAFLSGCDRTTDVPVPSANWAIFDSPEAVAVPAGAREAMEGVYRVEAGAGDFGGLAALKWSYLAQGNDTTYYLSAFCGTDVAYFIMEGRRLGQALYFEGYWRKGVNTQTGVARFTITEIDGADWLVANAARRDSLTIKGVYGNGSEEPTQKLLLRYLRPLNTRPYHILAHRSGGRTSDLLPVSENSVAMIEYASRLGSTGIEVDVRLTKDGVPILYHDNTLNLRLIQKNGLVGPVEDYTFQQLSSYVRLIHGERIPTLREALDAVLYRTPLTFVWLDTKYAGSLAVVRDLQREYRQKAAAANRQLEIVIGLPDEEKVNMYKALPDYTSAPALCELDLATVRQINARIWAPRWTLGTQDAEVAAMKAEGRQVFVWTLDVPGYVQQFVNQGDFDGILSNYPCIVAYYHYIREE